MAVAVNIDVARRAGALIIPAAAVHEGEDGTWVFAVRGGRVERRALAVELHGEKEGRGEGGPDRRATRSFCRAPGWWPGQRVRTREALPGVRRGRGAEPLLRRPAAWPRVLPAPGRRRLGRPGGAAGGRASDPGASEGRRARVRCRRRPPQGLPTTSQLVTGRAPRGARGHGRDGAPPAPRRRRVSEVDPALRAAARRARALTDDALLGECEETFFVGSGPGGQHRNKTESGVRLAHPPTGVTVTATERRSQLQNRGAALERLRARLDGARAPAASAGGRRAPPAARRSAACKTKKRAGRQEGGATRRVRRANALRSRGCGDGDGIDQAGLRQPVHGGLHLDRAGAAVFQGAGEVRDALAAAAQLAEDHPVHRIHAQRLSPGALRSIERRATLGTRGLHRLAVRGLGGQAALRHRELLSAGPTLTRSGLQTFQHEAEEMSRTGRRVNPGPGGRRLAGQALQGGSASARIAGAPPASHLRAMARAVLFDIDGTLMDTVDLHAQAWQEALARFGKQIPYDEIRAQIGKGGDQLLPVFLDEEELERFGERSGRVPQRACTSGSTFPGRSRSRQRATSSRA